MKSPIQRRSAIAGLLLAPALTACGFNAQTDQVYQPAVGINDRDGEVDVLNALIVTGQDGTGTFAGTLVNNTDDDDRLDAVSGPDLTASRRTVDIAAHDVVNLADSGQVTLRGERIEPGNFVELTLTFQNAAPVTVTVPVVENTGPYAEVTLPGARATESAATE
ncbi:MAG TPA: hypothetical protein VGE14_04425 [Marmoricola sp.]